MYVKEHRSGLPAAMKANIQEAGGDVKESGLFEMLSIWKVDDSCHKAHLHVSLEAEGFFFFFIRRDRGIEQTDQERGLQNS